MPTREKYLKSLSFGQLLKLFEDAIRHNHYCPCECHCFDDWKYEFNVSEVRAEINRLVSEAIST